MNQRKNFAVPLLLTLSISLVSCRKEKEKDMYQYLFYGKWETSYGDTILFSRESNKNIITYDPELYPANPSDAKKEFIYTGGKLGIKDEYGSPGSFRVLQTFTWEEEGKFFTVQGKDWFPSITSDVIYFTFTRIK